MREFLVLLKNLLRTLSTRCFGFWEFLRVFLEVLPDFLKASNSKGALLGKTF